MSDELLLTIADIGSTVLSVAVKDHWCFRGDTFKDNLPSYQAVAEFQLAEVKQHYKTLIEDTLRDFSDIRREEGHPKSYWAGYHYARILVMSALKMVKQKRLDRPDKENIQWQMAEKLYQKRHPNDNWATEVTTIRAAYLEEAGELLALIPDIEEIKQLKHQLYTCFDCIERIKRQALKKA